MMKFIFRKTRLPGVLVVRPEVRSDGRGTASENYKYSEFKKVGIRHYFVQENRSVSRKGVLRGLHFQRAPRAQAKLVRCARGRIYDVVVDLRPRSKTYGKSFGIELSEANGLMLYAPEGFAHGFCALSDGAEVLYRCSDEYSPAHEGGVRWNDPALKINWPVKRPVVSERDSGLPLLGLKGKK